MRFGPFILFLAMFAIPLVSSFISRPRPFGALGGRIVGSRVFSDFRRGRPSKPLFGTPDQSDQYSSGDSYRDDSHGRKGRNFGRSDGNRLSNDERPRQAIERSDRDRFRNEDRPAERSFGDRDRFRSDDRSAERSFGDRDRFRNDNRPAERAFGERDRFRTDDRPAERSFGGRYNTYDRNRYGNEDKPEPVYGRYDGDHIYGVNSVRLALMAGRREIKELIIQTGMDLANKKDATAVKEILQLAEQKGIEVREFSKHDLNMMSDNKPHQGFVLRAQPLNFTSITHLEPSAQFSCVLALDEVWDPQNFGALLRTAYFLRCDKVVVCSKNSAPLSGAVSRASAGALEVMPVYSTNNLMAFLDRSKENGWQVVGTDLSPRSVSLSEVPRTAPTVLVLGNEGHGIRTNILRRCTHLVRIGSSQASASPLSDEQTFTVSTIAQGVDAAEETAGGVESDLQRRAAAEVLAEGGAVDSLNVSVAGAIIMHHFMHDK